MDSQIGQGDGLGFAITPVWVGSQTVLPDWMVALAGLHAEEGCRQVFVLRQASGYALESNRL